MYTTLNTALGATRQQRLVDSYFDSGSTIWKEIYERKDVHAIIHQQRRVRVLEFIDSLRLAPGTSVLEVGCGAGLTTAALAERRFSVQAIDSVPAMVKLTTDCVARVGAQDRVTASLGDAHRLSFPNDTFSVVLALGVVPWLHSCEAAIREMARVVKPGGYVIVNADNRWRLSDVLDPVRNPLHAPLRRIIRSAAVRCRLTKSIPPARRHSLSEFDKLLSAAGLTKLQGRTLGFGPFSFLKLHIVPNALGRHVHFTLQSLSDCNVPGIRAAGAQYIVFARKRREDKG